LLLRPKHLSFEKFRSKSIRHMWRMGECETYNKVQNNFECKQPNHHTEAKLGLFEFRIWKYSKIFEFRSEYRIRIVSNNISIFVFVFDFRILNWSKNIRKWSKFEYLVEYLRIFSKIFENIRFLPNKPKKQIFSNKNMKIWKYLEKKFKFFRKIPIIH